MAEEEGCRQRFLGGVAVAGASGGVRTRIVEVALEGSKARWMCARPKKISTTFRFYP
jgi:hypothetical protein